MRTGNEAKVVDARGGGKGALTTSELAELRREETHSLLQVGDLCRVRWEIELDRNVEQAGATLDEISARKPVSGASWCLPPC